MGGLARVYATNGNLRESAAIAGSLFLIVLASVLLGTLLPFLLVGASSAPWFGTLLGVPFVDVVRDALGMCDVWGLQGTEWRGAH